MAVKMQSTDFYEYKKNTLKLLSTVKHALKSACQYTHYGVNYHCSLCVEWTNIICMSLCSAYSYIHWIPSKPNLVGTG